MTNARTMQDLVILVPDRNIEAALTGVLARTDSCGISRPTYTIYTHLERDPGCVRRSHDFLRTITRQFRYALVVFDHEGCGQEDLSAESLEDRVRDQLFKNGWPDRAEAVAIDPELENWIWSDSPHVARALGWPSGDMAALRRVLHDEALWAEGATKPSRPKETLEYVLRTTRIPRSSSVYADVASRVSFTRCTDASFGRLLRTLRTWFPVGDTPPSK